MDWTSLWYDLGKLSFAALAGGLIGFEREVHGQAAGLRTYILVCLGSCLMMLLSLHMEELFRQLEVDQSVVRLDPGRIASYAIASMGFLGAGAIITGRGTVRGLTTAAGLWLVTGIGLSIGAGLIVRAAAVTVISVVILYGLRQIKTIFPREEHTLVTLTFDGLTKVLTEIKSILAGYDIQINFTNYRVDLPSRTVTYRLRLQSHEDSPWGAIIKDITGLPGLREIKWEEGEVP